ncbi:MAG: beta-lactamase family protein [Bacteroidota bacterium]|nr:beta-lactamase family protein [Bacteroidota bacterium]
MKKISFLCGITLVMLFGVSKGQGVGSGNSTKLLTHTIDSLIQDQVDQDQIPGAVIQVKRNGKVVYTHAYGYSQKYGMGRKPIHPAPLMNTSTLFDMASLTKMLGTTTSIMILEDRGMLNVDDPVGKYLKSFDSGAKKAVTLRNLLTHTAGLYEWYPLFYYAHNRQSAYRFIGSLPLKYPVDQRRSYSDLGFDLLGEIIEKVSGMSLDQFERKNIFIPLGMPHTTYNPLKHGRTSNIAATSFGNPYEYRMVHDPSLGFAVKGLDPNSWNGWRNYVLKGEVNDGNAWYACGGISGAAGLFSTVSDMQKLVDMLMNQGKVGAKQFISSRVVRSFFVQDGFHNGLGWMMDPEDSFMKDGPAGTFGHTGFTGTSIAVVPKYDLSIILLINRQNMGLQKSGTYYNPNNLRREIFTAAMEWCGAN